MCKSGQQADGASNSATAEAANLNGENAAGAARADAARIIAKRPQAGTVSAMRTKQR